jgi:hypothetical protein
VAAPPPPPPPPAAAVGGGTKLATVGGFFLALAVGIFIFKQDPYKVQTLKDEGVLGVWH